MAARPSDRIRLPRNESAPSELVVEAVATCLHASPTELGVRLYDVVDPDALDRLFQHRPDGTARTEGQVEFQVAGCRVTVTESTVSAHREDP